MDLEGVRIATTSLRTGLAMTCFLYMILPVDFLIGGGEDREGGQGQDGHEQAADYLVYQTYRGGELED